MKRHPEPLTLPPTGRWLHWLFRLLLLLALAAITHLATTPLDHPLLSGLHDKLQHLLAFLALALLTDLAFPAPPWHCSKTLFLLAYGLAIEIIQSYIPYREFSLADLLADGLGLLLYALVRPVLLKTPLGRHIRGDTPA